MVHFVEQVRGTGSYHSKRKTVSGGSRCGDLCRITGKSKASGIYKGHLHHLQQCKMTLEEVIHVIERGGSRGKDNCPPSYRRSMYLRCESVNRWIFWMRKISLMITVRVSVHSAVLQEVP